MPALNLFNAFKADIANKAHDLSANQLKVALTNVAPSATNSVLADITEIDYSNLSSRNVTTTSSSQSGGTYKYIVQDLVLTASGNVPAFRYVVYYNDTTASDQLIGYVDNGSSINLTAGQTVTLNMDQVQGLIYY